MSLCLCTMLALLAGCGGRISTNEIRQDLTSGSLDKLEGKMEGAWKSAEDFATALNLARMYQLIGEWEKSKGMYEEALKLLEEYEDRAIVNMRSVMGHAGAATFSRGSLGYHGYGYERSLLHTFNGLNYLMLGDYDGAAVEMKRMEKRQELWLKESENKIKEHAENLKEIKSSDKEVMASLGQTHEGATLGAMLNDPSVRKLTNSYQDAFSYALSAAVNRLAGDTQYADVSMRRAMQLNEHAESIFRAAWGSGGSLTVPALPHSVGNKQEVLMLGFSGLVPALHMEQTRLPYSFTGYLMIDFPTFYQPMPAVSRAPSLHAGKNTIQSYRLLDADALAYRSLKDDMPFEIGISIGRAITRAVATEGTRAAFKSQDNEDLAAVGDAAALVVNLLMDLFASGTSDNIRNWEMLPGAGFMAMGTVPRGSSFNITFGNGTAEFHMPSDVRGVIIMISEIATSNLRVDYVTY